MFSGLNVHAAGQRRCRAVAIAVLIFVPLVGATAAAPRAHAEMTPADVEAVPIELVPASGAPGTDVVVGGKMTDACRDTEVTIDWQSSAVEPIRFTVPANAPIRFAVPPGARAGRHGVTVACTALNGKTVLQYAGRAAFDVTSRVELAPDEAEPGTDVTAIGSFPTSCPRPAVVLGGTTLAVTQPATDPAAEAVMVTFEVPRDLPPGSYPVTLVCGRQSATAPLTVTVSVPTTPPESPSTTSATTAPPGRTGPVNGGAGVPGTPDPPTSGGSRTTATTAPAGSPTPGTTPSQTSPGASTSPAVTPTADRFVLARPDFTASLTPPDEVRWHPADIARSLAAVAVLFFLAGFPAELFNRALEENRDRLPAWWRRDPPAETARTSWLHLAGFTAISAILLGLVENGAGLDGQTAMLVLALLVAVPLTALAYSGTAELYQRGPDRESGQFRVLAIGLVIAAVCVLLSRLAGFQPGYAYGLFGFFAVRAALARHRAPRQARSVLWGAVTLLGLGVVAWLVWVPVDHAAERPGAGADVLFLDSLLAATFVLAIQGAVFGLVPVEFMDGKKLWRWDRVRWATVWGVALFLFAHVLFGRYLSEFDPVRVVAVVLPFLLFGLISVGLWLYLRLTGLPHRSPPGPSRV